MCTGPVTPSTGPVHTFSRPPSRLIHESPFRKCEFGGTMIRTHRQPRSCRPGEGDRSSCIEPDRSDRSSGDLVRPHDDIRARRRKDRESGQAMVEFALILLPLLMLVAGIIQFGIGLNYWLDMQRLANQGARWAVVNAWPGCPRTATPAAATHPGLHGGAHDSTLANYAECQADSRGLENTGHRDSAPGRRDLTTTNGSVGRRSSVQPAMRRSRSSRSCGSGRSTSVRPRRCGSRTTSEPSRHASH